MASIKFSNDKQFAEKLLEFERMFDDVETLNNLVYQGAKIVADEIRKKLAALPEDEFRKLKPGEKFRGVPRSVKDDLLSAFGLAPIESDKNGFRNTKAGFDGYGSHPTPKYPRGVPNQLVARAVESGSSVRQKTPFVRPAVRKARKMAIEKMEKTMDEMLKDAFG